MSNDTASWVGQVLAGRYRVLAKLGEGGMAHVYRALEISLGREVVIKVPRRAMLDDPDFAPRFAREARSLAQLSHAHIVKIHDVGTHDGFPFLILEFLPGGSLGDGADSGRGESGAAGLGDIRRAKRRFHSRYRRCAGPEWRAAGLG